MLVVSRSEKNAIATGDIEVLKQVLSKTRLDNIVQLSSRKEDHRFFQGAGQLLTELLDIFQLKVCLKSE